MRGCSGGGVWLLGGACMVAWGGMHGCSGGGVHGCSRGMCMVAPVGGCAWLLGGHAWLLGGACVVARGGACMVFSMRYGQ